MYALFGVICLVATPVFGALCLYNKATHKKDNRMLIAFFVSFAVFVICFAVTPDSSSKYNGASSSSAASAEPESVESSSVTESESQTAESESEPSSTQASSTSESIVAESASAVEDQYSDIPTLDLDDYIKEYEDNAVKAKNQYGGKRYKVTYKVSSVIDGMMKVDNPYTVQFTINFVTSHSIGYTTIMAGFPESERGKIASLSPGQTVTFVGDFDGGRFTDCEFIVP